MKVRLEFSAYPASTISLGSQVVSPLTISRHMKKATQIMRVPSARRFLNSALTGLPGSRSCSPVNSTSAGRMAWPLILDSADRSSPMFPFCKSMAGESRKYFIMNGRKSRGSAATQ
ncbi:hypothetical protein QFZ65_002524 [Arthrobacter sp. B3I9]|nr:hypothetical protein [Arthrobacter sp. B3I9]